MTDSTDNARGPERHADTARNVILNRTLTDLDAIINGHDPEVDTSINNLVWDRLDKMAVEIEARAAPDPLADPRVVALVKALRKAASQHRIIAGMDLMGGSSVAYNAARKAEAALATFDKGGKDAD